MTQLDISEAGSKLADLVAKAKAGEEVLISDGGKTVARLVATEDNPRAALLGKYTGQIWMSDDFADPLTDEELKDWGL